jgi:hypothetical protein
VARLEPLRTHEPALAGEPVLSWPDLTK